MYLGGMDIYIYSSCSSVQTAIKALLHTAETPFKRYSSPFLPSLFPSHEDFEGKDTGMDLHCATWHAYRRPPQVLVMV
jgi:hypothetical protein